MKRCERNIRLTVTFLCELFTLATIAMLLATDQTGRIPACCGTLLLVLVPAVAEKLLRCRLSLPVYVVSVLYTLGPLLGNCWNLYYLLGWWDKVLHFTGGVLFAIVGWYLCQLLSKEKAGPLLCAVFALCFSMAVSMLWEFVEFASDRLLHTDMQADTVIHTVYSYLLDGGLGVAGSLQDIGSVVVDGAALPVAGYIDIGLFDTMWDMILETLGALITCALCAADKGKHPPIISTNRKREDTHEQSICTL